MHYVVDVIQSPYPSSSVRRWFDQAERLRCWPGLRSAELFVRRRNLRDAHYDLLAVYTWQRTTQCHQATLGGALAHVPGARTERGQYMAHIQFGDLRDDESGCWLINPFEITHEQMPAVLDMWNRAKDQMITRPGFVNARLLRTVQPTGRYALVNLSQWENEASFMAALDDKRYNRHRDESMQYKLHPSLCERIGLVMAEADTIPTPA